jgi:hypothetical protein
MKKLAGIVLLLAIAFATIQLYGAMATCYASIDCEGGWWDPTAQCDDEDLTNEIFCYTYVEESESHYHIHAKCSHNKANEDDCEYR